MRYDYTIYVRSSKVVKIFLVSVVIFSVQSGCVIPLRWFPMNELFTPLTL